MFMHDVLMLKLWCNKKNPVAYVYIIIIMFYFFILFNITVLKLQIFISNMTKNIFKVV